jgi:hypothetical protein
VSTPTLADPVSPTFANDDRPDPQSFTSTTAELRDIPDARLSRAIESSIGACFMDIPIEWRVVRSMV